MNVTKHAGREDEDEWQGTLEIKRQARVLRRKMAWEWLNTCNIDTSYGNKSSTRAEALRVTEA